MDELREAWLTKAVEALRPKFLDDPEITLPEKVRVSCSWPSSGGMREKNRVIGQCWLPLAAADGVPQVCISPVLATAYDALETLLHELIHTCFPEGTGHKGPFKRASERFGFVGPPATNKAGEELKKDLEAIAEVLGDYPHAELRKLASGGKKQTTRMLKIHCEAGHDPYVLRGAKKAVELGVPDCPVCGSEMKVDTPEDGEGEEE